MGKVVFPVSNYDLGATLGSGQAFRWRFENGGWTGIVGSRWVRLQAGSGTIIVETAGEVSDWQWLIDYLQINLPLEAVLETFPSDEPMSLAIAACRGLRLLQQDPWECLASFILSSTKQIVQIEQIVSQVCSCFGDTVEVPSGYPAAFSFPSARRLAFASETELRACKMGFRAPYLLATAKKISTGHVDLLSLRGASVEEARAALMDLPGVGPKIANCVLLFAYGFQSAFPVDVWVMKALRELYFRGRPTKLKRLQTFAKTHFGPNAGYAQQYLFHYMRTIRSGKDRGSSALRS